MTRRSIILVSCGVLAVLVGLAVALIGRSDTESSAASATTTVLVASERISSGTAADGGLVVTKEVSASERQLGALTDPAQLVGRTFATEVGSGDQVVLSDLETPTLRESAIDVPEGTEAVAIDVPFVAGGAGYAAPGDAVNVFALLDAVEPGLDPAAAADGAPASGTVSVLSNVVVLDVSVEVAPRVAARTDAVAASSTTTTAPAANAAPPTQVTYLLAVPVADVADLVQAAGFHRLYVSIPAKGTAPRPAASSDDAALVGGGR